MPVTVTIEVKGLRELGERMRELGGPKAQGAATSATGAGAKLVNRYTKANIQAHPSVRTGSLLNSVISKRLPKSERQGVTSVHIVTYRGRGKPSRKGGTMQASAPHANLIEFGTVKMSAEPSLGPALNDHVQEVIQEMTETLRRRLFT